MINTNTISKLPNNWIKTTIGELVEFEYGKGLPKEKRDKSGQIPVYGSNGIVGKHSIPLVNEPCIIIGRKGAAGEIHLSKTPCYPIDTTYYVRTPKGIDLIYFYFLLKSLKLGQFDKSTAIPGLNRNDAYRISIGLAPLQEQHRIVTKIEELFTQFDVSITSLKKVQAQLTLYRQAVLKAAFEGKLTQEWRERHYNELESAEVLLTNLKEERRIYEKGNVKKLPSYEIANLPPLPEKWIWTYIGSVLEVVRGASPRPKGDPRYFGGKIPWIMIADVTSEKGIYISKTKETVTEGGANKSRFLKKGTLILSNSATVCVPKILAIDGCIHDGFVAFPNLSKNLEISYLYYYFEFIRPKIIQENRQGVTQVNLNTKIVREIPLRLPPYVEQLQIVAEIERHFSIADNMEDMTETSIKQIETMRRSILNRAFEGKLVPQDPADEPASVLLKRIEAEKVQLKPDIKKKKKSSKLFQSMLITNGN